MVTIQELMQSEIDAVNLYSEFLRQHHFQLAASEVKKLKAIIKDEKDHLRIDRQIAKGLR